VAFLFGTEECVKTCFIESTDHIRLAYDCCGSGPGLLLLHGMPQGRRGWHEFGYVERLCPYFTVVTLDLRGHGESEGPEDSAAYALDHFVADVHEVARCCQLDRFSLWGFSFGGTLGLHLAARSARVQRAVIAGSHFGCALTEEVLAPAVAQAKAIALARAEGHLGALGLSPASRALAERLNISAQLACLRALPGWPPIEPQEIRCPMLIYVGSDDEPIASRLEQRRAEIEAAGITLQTLASLTHQQEVSAIETVLPPVLEFLSGKAAS
jgi:pimeloyl-ACP methyl ester carboxylesterase